MIALRTVADLQLSAASGLVRSGPHLFVVADDELFLDTYGAASGALVARIPFSPETLPAGAARKRAKPDLESLLVLPDGRILALGSGSAARRHTGYLFSIGGPAGLPVGAEPISLAPLYRALGVHFTDLNIEGGAVTGERVRLLQRGNGAGGQNAIIDLDLAGTLRAIERRDPLGSDLVWRVLPVDLGTHEGVRLGFTDASPIAGAPGKIAFSAAAEDTDDPYLDGATAGSVIGVLDEDARVIWVAPVEGRYKIEGLTLAEDGTTLLVADPDDRSRRAPLLAGPALGG